MLEKPKPKIKRVYHLRNDRIIAFDENRNQLPEYDGRFEDVIDKVMADADEGTAFYVQGYGFPVVKEAFKDKSIFKIIGGG